MGVAGARVSTPGAAAAAAGLMQALHTFGYITARFIT